MRLPDMKNLYIPTSDSEPRRKVTIDSISIQPEYFDNELLNDEKSLRKYVEYLERIIRGSLEYKRYIGFLKNELNLTKCTFLPEIDINEIKGVSLEFHHYPYTLFDITYIVLNDHIKSGAGIDAFIIAEEIMKLHYENIIGLVPLSKTVHQLAHSGKQFIPLKYVVGNFKRFEERYDCNLNNYPELMDAIKKLDEEIELGYKTNDMHSLQTIFTDIEIVDIEKPNKIVVEQQQYA